MSSKDAIGEAQEVRKQNEMMAAVVKDERTRYESHKFLPKISRFWQESFSDSRKKFFKTFEREKFLAA
jgi:hypothetical protein